jgi:hypothetical protein
MSLKKSKKKIQDNEEFELEFEKPKVEDPSPAIDFFRGYQDFEVENVDDPELFKRRSNSVMM